MRDCNGWHISTRRDVFQAEGKAERSPGKCGCPRPGRITKSVLYIYGISFISKLCPLFSVKPDSQEILQISYI